MRFYSILSNVLCGFFILYSPVMVVHYCIDGTLPVQMVMVFVSMVTAISILCFVAACFFEANKSPQIVHGYIALGLIWTITSIVAASWFQVYGDIAWYDAWFSAVSGLTTTGAEVFSDIDLLPFSFRFYRLWLQFLGGLGIILMIAPMLSSREYRFGIQFDLPGPVVGYSQKHLCLFTLARYLFYIYCSCTLVVASSFHFLGLSWFEAISESFSVVSTGGYHLYQDGILHYQSKGLLLVTIFFMIFSSVNYLLHYQFFILRELSGYRFNLEFRAFCIWAVVIKGLVICSVWYFSADVSVLAALFTAVSLLTSTGFLVTPLLDFPNAVPYFLVLIGVVGGCSGSTSGGIKMIRMLFGLREVTQACHLLRHPQAVLSSPAIDVGFSEDNMAFHTTVLRGFLVGFFIIFVCACLWLVSLGLSFEDAFFATVACLSNTGVFLSTKGTTFVQLSVAVKLVLCLLMLVGRIEILAFFMLLLPLTRGSR